MENRETAARILEVIEDFLESKGVTIPNTDRQYNGDETEAAILYGGDYYELEDGIVRILEQN